jgi:hypothetical protein
LSRANTMTDAADGPQDGDGPELQPKPRRRPLPPIPQKGQPRRVRHCQTVTIKDGDRTGICREAPKYIRAVNQLLDRLAEGMGVELGGGLE